MPFIYKLYIIHFQWTEWRERNEWHGLHELESKTRPRLKAWSPASTNQPAWFHSALLIFRRWWASGRSCSPFSSAKASRGEEKKQIPSAKGCARSEVFQPKGIGWLVADICGLRFKASADIRAFEVLNPSQSLVVVRNARSCHGHIAVVSSEYLPQPNGSSRTKPTVVRCTVASHGTESEEGPCAAAHWAERCYLPHRASCEGFCVLGISSWVGRGSPS